MLLHYIILHQCETQYPTQHAVQNVQSSLHDTAQKPCAYVVCDMVRGLVSMFFAQFVAKAMEQEEQEEEQDQQDQQEDANQEVEALPEEDIRNFRSEFRQNFFCDFFYFASLSLGAL